MKTGWLSAVVRFVFGDPNAPASKRPAPSAPDDSPVDALDAPFVMPIEDALDLHFFARRDLPGVVDEYLRAARLAGFTEVRLIHGRGKSIARAMVEKIVDGSRHAARRAPAPAARGGAGATLVWLTPGKPDDDS